MSPERRRGRRVVGALLATLAVTLAACGGGGTVDVTLPPLPPTTSSTLPATTLPASSTTRATTATTAASVTTTTAAPSPADRVTFRGSSSFVTGVNLPWLVRGDQPGHGDFGGGTVDGVRANAAQLTEAFARVRATGTSVVRWFLFPGQIWQVTRDADRRPTGLDPAVLADLDAAIQIAEQQDVYLVLTLFEGARYLPASWRSDPAHREALVAALGPMFERTGRSTHVLAWEVFSEPEWDIWNSGGLVTESDVLVLGDLLARSVRSKAPGVLVTVGNALVAGFNPSQRSIAPWLQVDLDFFAPHWFDDQLNPPAICALCRTAPDIQQAYQTSRPIVIGAALLPPGNTQANVARLNEWYTKGYAGVWLWVLFSDGVDGKPAIDLQALATFNAQHPDIGPRRAGG